MVQCASKILSIEEREASFSFYDRHRGRALFTAINRHKLNAFFNLHNMQRPHLLQFAWQTEATPPYFVWQTEATPPSLCMTDRSQTPFTLYDRNRGHTSFTLYDRHKGHTSFTLYERHKSHTYFTGTDRKPVITVCVTERWWAADQWSHPTQKKWNSCHHLFWQLPHPPLCKSKGHGGLVWSLLQRAYPESCVMAGLPQPWFAVLLQEWRQPQYNLERKEQERKQESRFQKVI